MKRLLLLLAAMGIVSATAMAEEPALKLKSVGQELEIENYSGKSNVGEYVWLVNSVTLGYEDWNLNLQGVKMWNVDTEAGIESKLGRAQLTASKPVSDNLTLGARVRLQQDYDKYYGFYNYANGGFSSEGWFWYTASNAADGGNDAVGVEAWPLKYTFGDFGVAWYVCGEAYTGSFATGDETSYIENQARFYWDFYQGEKLSLNAEYRLQLNHNRSFEGGAVEGESVSKEFGTHTLYLNVGYDVTESLNVYGYYGYQIADREDVKTGETDESGKYYGDFGIGWSYSF